MNLPPELRNEIYKLVALSEPQLTYRKPFNFMQPGLFRCSKKSRQEGLPFFYKYSHFRFDIHQKRPASSLRDVVDWFVRLDPVLRKSISTVTVRDSIWHYHRVYTSDMAILHSKLSDNATVTYQCSRDFEQRQNLKRIKRFFKILLPGKELDFQEGGLVGTTSLTFLPGQSWFGENVVRKRMTRD